MCVFGRVCGGGGCAEGVGGEFSLWPITSDTCAEPRSLCPSLTLQVSPDLYLTYTFHMFVMKPPVRFLFTLRSHHVAAAYVKERT